MGKKKKREDIIYERRSTGTKKGEMTQRDKREKKENNKISQELGDSSAAHWVHLVIVNETNDKQKTNDKRAEKRREKCQPSRN